MTQTISALLIALFSMTVGLSHANETTRESTGGAQTLQDILARQAGQQIDDSFRRDATGNPDAAKQITEQLGVLGGVSDSEVFRGIRYSDLDIKVSNSGPAADILVQDGGMRWLELRQGPLATYGGGALLGIIGLLVIFYFARGRIMIDGGPAGTTIERFKAVERFGHWVLASSFVLLGITGLLTLLGRQLLIPVIGHEAFSTLAIGSKWIHNNVAWAFMLGLFMTFFMWVWHNIPNKLDLVWFAKGGGIFGKEHPPAKKFNAGQKIIFWTVMVLGFSVSLSGISLLFPFEYPMFAKTFAIMNSVFGSSYPTELLPHEEMQYAQIWHAIVAFVMMVAIVAHIYIGSVGMEGAFDAMGNGQVDLEWARQHHSLWVAEEEAKGKIPAGSSLSAHHGK